MNNELSLHDKNLNDDDIKKIIDSCDKTNEVVYLFLYNNKINNIYDGILLFVNLLCMDVSDNLIETIELLPENLEELNCVNCNITFICSHKKLKRLNCVNNKIDNINDYPELQSLYCGENQINHIENLNNLVELSCNNNPINNLFNLPMLTSLDCSKTNIQNIYNMPKLIFLQFDNTPITELLYMPKLENIVFNNHNIQLSENYKIADCYEYDGCTNVFFK
jgi:Leucine-rich repeat (LRR) protein